MKSSRAAITAGLLTAGILFAPSARAELEWPKLTLSSYSGISHVDRTYQVSGGFPGGVRAGFTFSGRLGLEGSYGKVLGKSPRVPGHHFPLDQRGVDLVLYLSPDAKFNPYVFGGWAEFDLDQPFPSALRLPGKEFGAGVRIRLASNSAARWDLRLDARDLIIKNAPPLDDPDQYKGHFQFTAGISMTLANPERDTDGDGVLDQFDHCPNTVAGAQVDPFGCPLDYDQDGVPDGIDRCPSTPRGAVVDAHGCPTDADGDGVPDGVDLCADTPLGVVVDARGCALDSDGDGVFDGIDQCPGTPPRVLVDAVGCPLTPTVSAAETELLDTGSLVLDNVTFDLGQATLKERSYPVLDEVGKILTRRPELNVEISGHTDASGDAVANLELSRNRAQAVLDYLLRRFPLDPKRFTVLGYGESRPLDSGSTPEARARNRRVEFKIVPPPSGH